MTRRLVRAQFVRSAFVSTLAVAVVANAAPAAGQVLDDLTTPSPEDILGYPIGGDFTPAGAVVGYFEELAAASPLVTVERYGVTPEGRDLVQIVIAAPRHRARLDEILELNAEFTRAGTSAARAAEIAAMNPAVVYFSFGVHGNESSSSEAAMWAAYDLASGSREVAGALDSLVVVFDPVTNPDGRDRYVNWYRSVVGAEPNAQPQTREHREPWPSGRVNHYLYDLNRDWAWMTQPETRARLATWFRWNPQVHVDFHEMSPNSTYFFFPAAAPINPIYADHVLEWGRRFGQSNARAFDANGWTYFTGESYDLLYPGYGDTWPSLLGAVGMTYEQAGGGAAGLRYARTDGDTLTLERRAMQHRTAALATLRAATAEKTRLLLDFAAANRTAGEGERDFVLVPGSDPARFDALVAHLLAQGIAVERAASSVRMDASPYPGYSTRRDFPAGTVLVRARQPRGRLAVTLLQPETEVRAEYSYDITAWSLAYAYGVEAHRAEGVPASGWSRVESSEPPAAGLAEATYGYLVAANERSAPAIIRFLRDGGTARVLTRPASFAAFEWPAGTWFIPLTLGGPERPAIEAAGLGAFAVPIAGGMSESGIDLGSASVRALRLPTIALIGGDGVNANSFGAHWYHLEQHLGLPFDAILLPEVTRIDLARYDVIVLPEASAVNDAARGALASWVRAGGRLIAVGSGASTGAAIAEVDLRQANDEEDSDESMLDRLLSTRAERERVEWREDIPGAILPVRIDPDHPLMWGASSDGLTERLFVLHTAGRVFEPRDGAEAAAFFAPNLLPTSGTISDANLDRLERGAWLMTRNVGSGEVVLFADDPLFRLFWKGTFPLYRNAILYGAR